MHRGMQYGARIVSGNESAGGNANNPGNADQSIFDLHVDDVARAVSIVVAATYLNPLDAMSLTP